MNGLVFWKRFALMFLVVAGICLPAADVRAQISGVCVMPFVPPVPPPPEKDPDPRCNIECKTCTGSPCFVGTGNYTTDATDLQMPTSGFPLEISRRYDSTRFADGLSGVGWNSTPMTRLYYATYLFAAPSTYNRRAVITFPTGLSYQFNENADGINYTPPAGRKDVLVKNADATFTLTLERSRSKYQFSATGHLTSMTDEFGNALNVTYDASSRPQRIAGASGSGRFIDLFYGADGRISAVQDHTGRTVQYVYDASGYLSTVTDPMARNTSYEYVASRFRRKMSRIADHWNREITAMTYDSSGRLNSYTEEGMLYTYTYFFTSPSKRDALGNEWSFFYGTGGVVTKRVFPGGGEHRNDIDAEGRTIFFIDEVGDRTSTSYLSDGRVAAMEKGTGANPRVQHLYYSYDPTFPDKVAAITPMNFYATAPDRNWQEWKYDYYAPGSPAPGALHHVYRVLTDGTQQTMATYVYDSRGRVTSTADAAGAVTDYVYDAAGNLQSVTSPSNNDAGIRPVTTYAYDALGRVISVTDPLGKATSYTYDALDRITSVTLPRPSPGSPLNFVTTHLYDQYEAGTGLVWTQTTDPNGKITRQGHDPFGRLVRSTDALSATTLYTYDRHVLRSITDANGNVTSYEYDALQRLTATVFPDGARETYTYFLDGQLKTKTDRKNQTVTYAYDSLKRLTSKTYPNLTSITYTYAGQNLTQVSDTSTTPGETHTFSWDPAYRVSSNTQGPRGTLSYTYTAGDAVASYTVQGGPTASYTYYPDGSLNTIQWSPVTGQFKYAYTRNGQYQTITLPNGQTRNYSYDDQGRLVTLGNVHPSAGNLATYDYAYDLNHLTGQNTMLGQRVSLTATVPSQGLSAALTKYSYDGGYQLTRAEYPAPAPFNGEVHSWTYDAIGNRLTSTVNAATANYSYQKIGTNPNNWQRLLSDGVSGYTYDANGNAATKTGLTFGWDAENRLTSIGGTTTASYGYDYQGRRSAKTSGTTTSYLYDGLNLLRETPASPVDYLFGPGIDEPIAVSEGGAVHYPLVDGLGSVAGLASSVGVVANQYSYDAWGVTKSQSGTVSNAFGYTSREFGEGGLSFYRARFYNPSSGRFLSEDPIKSMSFSAYAYVGNRPTWFTDPSGKIRAKIPIRYRGVRYDQMKDLCGEPARGCAGFVSLEARCSCRCVGDQWVPMPWIAVAEIRIYVAMDCDDVGSTFKEEFRHAAVKQRDLEKENRRALDFRKESFGSKAACEFRCMRWEASTIANLANFWEHMFIDATHFLSGSSKCIR